MTTRNLTLHTFLFAAFAALLLPASARASVADGVSQDRLRADIETLVGFGTRSTLSSQDDPKRGIGAARKWGEAEFRKTSAACGGCLQIALPEKMVQGERIPKPVRLVDVVAIQRGTERPNEVVIVQGHLDSRATDVMDAVSDAPGANDDGSGIAVVLEAARALSQRKYPVTVVYALLSGEEQGLYGGELLAEYAKAQGWQVKAVLNNDIVGGSCGSDHFCDDQHVRVFSEGPRGDADARLLAAMRREGGENDSPSRNLARWIGRVAQADPGGLAVRQIWRDDRVGRGGDQIPFQALGYPAIRFTSAVEDYNREHQNVRTENGIEYGDTIEGVDFPYLAKVARLNIEALDLLARAPMPPAPVAKVAVSTSSELSWKPVPGAVSYAVWRRRTDQPYWEVKPVQSGVKATDVTLFGERGDDWFFGVSAIAADGTTSPIASAVPGGAFRPEATETK
jgi:hypothetical protein